VADQKNETEWLDLARSTSRRELEHEVKRAKLEAVNLAQARTGWKSCCRPSRLLWRKVPPGGASKARPFRSTFINALIARKPPSRPAGRRWRFPHKTWTAPRVEATTRKTWSPSVRRAMRGFIGIRQTSCLPARGKHHIRPPPPWRSGTGAHLAGGRGC
jgi:hypothetical protein